MKPSILYVRRIHEQGTEWVRATGIKWAAESQESGPAPALVSTPLLIEKEPR